MENNVNENVYNSSVNQSSHLQQTKVSLPNSTAVLVLGILSIVFCFCYGIVGIILAIIAIILANKDKKLYKENPDRYTQSSYNNIQAGFICAIIGLSLSAIYVIFLIFYLIILGTTITSMGPTFPWDVVNY